MLQAEHKYGWVQLDMEAHSPIRILNQFQMELLELERDMGYGSGEQRTAIARKYQHLLANVADDAGDLERVLVEQRIRNIHGRAEQRGRAHDLAKRDDGGGTKKGTTKKAGRKSK